MYVVLICCISMPLYEEDAMSGNKKLPPSDFLSNERLMNLFYQIPHKILQHHQVEGVAQLVLAEVAQHLGFKRASYFIDNPDFGCLKGVAGFCQKESDEGDVWQDPQRSLQSINQAAFHSSIKKFIDENVARIQGSCPIDELQKLGHVLGISQPHVHTWHMRHGNMGVLIYEKSEQATDAQEVLERATALLGLCPIHI